MKFTNLLGLAVEQIWQHKNGNIYKIENFTNREIDRQDEYPTTVVYRNVFTDMLYSRPFVRWAGSFERRADLESKKLHRYTVTVTYTEGSNPEQKTFEAKIVHVSYLMAIQLAKERFFHQVESGLTTVVWVNVISTVVGKMEEIK